MNTHYNDEDLVCSDCQMGFVWTGGEKKFMHRLLEEGKLDYRDRKTGQDMQGQVTPPKRCPDCRERRKAKQGVYERKNGHN